MILAWLFRRRIRSLVGEVKAFYDEGRHLEALMAASQALALEPENPSLTRNVAECLDALGRHDLACEIWWETYSQSGISYAALRWALCELMNGHHQGAFRASSCGLAESVSAKRENNLISLTEVRLISGILGLVHGDPIGEERLREQTTTDFTWLHDNVHTHSPYHVLLCASLEEVYPPGSLIELGARLDGWLENARTLMGISIERVKSRLEIAEDLLSALDKLPYDRY